MKITTDHSASSYGMPVILDNNGQLMDSSEGLTAVLEYLNWSRKDLAEHAGKSLRTVEGWWQGRQVPAEALNVLADELGKIIT